MICIDILINYLQKFLNHEIQNYWKETRSYKKFQTKLLDINEYGSTEKEYLYNKFLKFNNLTHSQFKELVYNSFIYNINEILQAGISKKQYSIYKLQGNSKKIDFKLPSQKKFLYYIVLKNAKFFYENIYIIKDKNFVIKKNIEDNIKTAIYSYIPINDILELQISIKKKTKHDNSTNNTKDSASLSSHTSSNSHTINHVITADTTDSITDTIRKTTQTITENNITENSITENSITENKSENITKTITKNITDTIRSNLIVNKTEQDSNLLLDFIKPEEKIVSSESTKLFVKNISVKGK